MNDPDATPHLACTALRDEIDALHALVETRDDEELRRETPFHRWRVLDQIAHLHFVDRLAALALTNPGRLAQEVDAMGQATSAPAYGGARGGTRGSDTFVRMSAHEHDRIGPLRPRALVAQWKETASKLVSSFEAEPCDRPIAWFGRTMKLERLIAARQMEVWAYGQDIFDAYRVERTHHERLQRVADFGARTFRFAFANRGLEIPPDPPFLSLTGPSGDVWEWNDPGASNRVAGDAVDFCLVATQRRHVDDTQLEVVGAVAQRWMTIAQCIAGAPVNGPRPGERVWRPA